MRSWLCVATAATTITLLSSSWAVAGQASESTVRVDRLASLAEVWAAVKYFHPYLGYREDIDWDAALLAVIPKVRAARTLGEYGEAIDSLLATLDDPVTRIVQSARSSVPTGPLATARPPAYRLTPEAPSSSRLATTSTHLMWPHSKPRWSLPPLTSRELRASSSTFGPRPPCRLTGEGSPRWCSVRGSSLGDYPPRHTPHPPNA